MVEGELEEIGLDNTDTGPRRIMSSSIVCLCRAFSQCYHDLILSDFSDVEHTRLCQISHALSMYWIHVHVLHHDTWNTITYFESLPQESRCEGPQDSPFEE